MDSCSVALLGTLGCHLCEEAEGILRAVLGEKVQIVKIDIAEREEWVEAYGLRIPVAETGGVELGWPFTQADVDAWWQSVPLNSKSSQLAAIMSSNQPKRVRRYLG